MVAEDKESLRFVETSKPKSSYPKDVEDFSKVQSTFHDRRHRRHHNNRILHQLKGSSRTDVQDRNITLAAYSSQTNASHISFHDDTKEPFKPNQVGSPKTFFNNEIELF